MSMYIEDETTQGYLRDQIKSQIKTHNRKTIPKKIRLKVYEKCKGHCAYCGCELEYKDMQVDHVIPLNGWSEQGTDTIDNMLPACRSCNHYKSRSTLEGFRKMVEAMPDTLMRDSTTYRNAVRFGLVIPNKKPIVFYFEKMKQTVEDVEDECEGCIHKDGCGIDDFFWDELGLSEEERFIRHCVGCCCGDGCECNKSHGCSNYEDGTEPLLG